MRNILEPHPCWDSGLDGLAERSRWIPVGLVFMWRNVQAIKALAYVNSYVNILSDFVGVPVSLDGSRTSSQMVLNDSTAQSGGISPN